MAVITVRIDTDVISAVDILRKALHGMSEDFYTAVLGGHGDVARIVATAEDGSEVYRADIPV